MCIRDRDGVDIIKKVRGWSNLPIIVVSARSEDQDKVDALDAGADDYLTKPFSVDEFLARVRVALRRSYTEASAEECSIYENGELKIDYAAGCVYVPVSYTHLDVYKRQGISGGCRPAEPSSCAGQHEHIVPHTLRYGFPL